MNVARGPSISNPSRAATLAVLLFASAATGDTPTATPAATYFDSLKSLEGEWAGESTRGWTDRITFRAIAAGSVVMATSFEAHPGQTMVTM